MSSPPDRTHPHTRRLKMRRKNLHQLLLRWYRTNGRTLPWRKARNPYRILVSEVMLQQTQVRRVLIKYPQFLKLFPTLHALARATRADVIRAWQGMGYNTRAVRLHRLAREIALNFGGTIPRNMDELTRLPGIGRYTASAIACFAFGQAVPVVDVNIARVLQRVFGNARSKDLWELARDLLPHHHADEWNQALMDLGATVCTSSNPRCGQCPLARHCASAFKAFHRTGRKKNEPSRNGIPNRIYRGKIIQALRHADGAAAVPADTIARTVNPHFSERDRRWFESLIIGLERDGLVVTKKRGRATLLSLAEENSPDLERAERP